MDGASRCPAGIGPAVKRRIPARPPFRISPHAAFPSRQSAWRLVGLRGQRVRPDRACRGRRLRDTARAARDAGTAGRIARDGGLHGAESGPAPRVVPSHPSRHSVPLRSSLRQPAERTGPRHEGCRHPAVGLGARDARQRRDCTVIAAQEGHAAVIEALGRLGADVNRARSDGCVSLQGGTRSAVRPASQSRHVRARIGRPQ